MINVHKFTSLKITWIHFFFEVTACLFFLNSAAFTKIVKNRGQEYNLELVDTAGQVVHIWNYNLPGIIGTFFMREIISALAYDVPRVKEVI